jgi:hypothetical protein
VQALRHGALAADLDDVLDALAVGRQLARRLAPVRVLAVVDDVVRAELLEDGGFVGGGGGRDDGCARGFGELLSLCQPLITDPFSGSNTREEKNIPATQTN